MEYTPKQIALRAAKALDDRKGLDIRLLDHLIVSRTSSYSFLDHGILERTYG